MHTSRCQSRNPSGRPDGTSIYEPGVSGRRLGGGDGDVTKRVKDHASSRKQGGKRNPKRQKARAVQLKSPDEVAAKTYGRILDNGEPRRDRRKKLRKAFYESELLKLQIELVKLQEWIKQEGMKVVVIFEGRDAAGKGGVIKRMTERLNPRICRIVALGTPTEREKTQWYFQRYVDHLPAAGEMVLFDRSWYNRAGVERVMGFCDEEAYREFLRSCPEFERMLARSGIVVIKYWFSVSDEEQEKRFLQRIRDRRKRWKLSDMDLQSRARWVDYSRAKDEMFHHTDIEQARWWVVDADDKKRARLNCIRHLLSQIPYRDLTPPPVELPPRDEGTGYVRPPLEEQHFVPECYEDDSAD